MFFSIYLCTEFFDATRIFRVVPGFVVQFGIPADSTDFHSFKVPIKDDPILSKYSNIRGTVTFATSGPDTRTTQMFINVEDNARLDGMGFAPVGRVLGDGMRLIDEIYSQYGEKPSQSKGEEQGNLYFDKSFPLLSSFTTWRTIAYRSRSKTSGTCTNNELKPLRTTSPEGCDAIVSRSNRTNNGGQNNGKDTNEGDGSLQKGTVIVVVLTLLLCAFGVGGYVWKSVRKDKRSGRRRHKVRHGARRVVLTDEEEDDDGDTDTDAKDISVLAEEELELV